jgi:hypothetical protein
MDLANLVIINERPQCGNIGHALVSCALRRRVHEGDDALERSDRVVT